MQNPKKQAIDTKLKAMACYLTNQRRTSKGEDHGAPPESAIGRLGFGCDAVAKQCNVGAVMVALVMLEQGMGARC